jgi:amylosucrase
MFAVLRNLIAVRARLPHLHASVASEIPDLADPGILPVLRRHPLGVLLELYNVTENWLAWPGSRLDLLGLAAGVDHISGDPVQLADDGNLWLAPYAAVWITAG